MSKAAFVSYLCHPFCAFFRASTNEELACQGAIVLEELLRCGRLAPSQLPTAAEKERRLWQKEDKTLERILCLPCSFAIDGCDFHSALRSEETEPCGGYLLLQLLKERGTITCADLNGASAGAAHVA